jgi:hypothetical protein
MHGIFANMDITVQTLSVLASVFAMAGSAYMVHAKYEDGAKAFLLGNTINIMVALSIGDVAFALCQAALAWYTLPMYKSRVFSGILISMATVLLVSIGVSKGFHFTLDPVSAMATPLAIIGAWAMSKQRYDLMGWMWIVADLAFVHVGVSNGLIGLTIQSLVFTYHGYLRVTHRKQTGLFTFTKAG